VIGQNGSMFVKPSKPSQRFSVKWHQTIQVSYGTHSPNRNSRNGYFQQIPRAVLAKQDIVSRKAHLLRSVNQEEARLDIVNALDNTSVLLVQDWAMKFLSRKFRESQTNRFAKHWISWHLTVAIRRGDDHKLQMMTFVNVFRSGSQDSCTVLSVMSDVVKQLREAQPQLENIYYWQDNAGCYYCGTTIVGAKLISQQHGVSVRWMPFL